MQFGGIDLILLNFPKIWPQMLRELSLQRKTNLFFLFSTESSGNLRRYILTISQISRGQHLLHVQTCFLSYPWPYCATLALRGQLFVLFFFVWLQHMIFQPIRIWKENQQALLDFKKRRNMYGQIYFITLSDGLM